jgi:hypothetical protein
MAFTMRELLGDRAPVIVDECPTGKHIYREKADARRAAVAINRVHVHQADRCRPMRAFRCAYCDRYHLGHRR